MTRLALILAAILAVSACAAKRDANVWGKISYGAGQVMGQGK